ncbi:MAG: ABC transporter ATP-binding protein, partial [Bacteroidetes bacterium]|nr:ABC transporter ATP-binding protein [Bacteroidota bacterium]
MPSPLRRLNTYLWRYKYLMIPGLLCALASAIFSLIVPRVVREAVDAVPRMVELHNLYAGTPAASDLFNQFAWALVMAGFFIVGLSMVSGFFSYLMRRTVVVASRHIEYDLRNRLYAHLQALSGDFYSRYATGDVMARSTSDIERVRRYIGPAYMYMARAVTAIIAALTVMFFISPTLTWWSLTPMPFLAIMVFFVAKMVHVRTDRQQKQYATLTSRVQEALSGIRVIKAYAREDFEAGRFDKESKGYQRRTLDLALVDAAFRPVIVVLIGLSLLLVVGVGGRLVIEGQLTIGNIAEFLIYVTILTWPVASFGFVISMVQQASASMSRIVEILDTEPAVQDGAQTNTSVESIEGRITFENVRFRYTEEGPAVLDGLSFDVPAGTTLGIVGRTGS